MSYSIGSTVVVRVFKSFQVGNVIDKMPTKTDVKYIVEMENGNVHENVFVDMKEADASIDSNITTSFIKSETNG
jgi:hypothetical protein